MYFSSRTTYAPFYFRQIMIIEVVFLNYLKAGKFKKPSKAKTLAERELLSAMAECEKFVSTWEANGHSLPDLVGHLKNNLTFILHEIDDESLVYTVFEVLNSRGLDVSWFDRLKSMLMAVVFKTNQEIGRKLSIKFRNYGQKYIASLDYAWD